MIVWQAWRRDQIVLDIDRGLARQITSVLWEMRSRKNVAVSLQEIEYVESMRDVSLMSIEFLPTHGRAIFVIPCNFAMSKNKLFYKVKL